MISIFTDDIMGEITTETSDDDCSWISCITNQIGCFVPKYRSFCSEIEMLTLLNSVESLDINNERNGFQINGEIDTNIDGLELESIKFLCAHPNMTDDGNQYMAVMDQS